MKVLKRSKSAFTNVLIGLFLFSVIVIPISSMIFPVSAAVNILTAKWNRSSLGTNWEGGAVLGDIARREGTGARRGDDYCQQRACALAFERRVGGFCGAGQLSVIIQTF